MAMDRITGKEILGIDDVEQSIDTILTTSPGERVMRADYGSELLKLTDIGISQSAKMRLASATGDAIKRFEPRVRVERTVFEATAGGDVTQTVYARTETTSQQVVVSREL